ncbi:MAG TPA: DUF2127 domain-containing protein [Anaerolineae bacterium]|nr:DUF2127 domain-containing protein [Anaerolineae bacterium]HIP70203.1 DUF2127 domain-containing protein [Anaerolineae bacterium]
METTATKKERPFGVKAIIFLHLVSAIAPLLAFFLLDDQSISRIISMNFFINLGFLATDQRVVEMGLLGAFAFLQAVLVVGLWQMRSWAWLLVMIVTGLSMVLQIWRYFQGFPDYVTMTINVLVVFYLNQRDMQQAFQRGRKSEGGQ